MKIVFATTTTTVTDSAGIPVMVMWGSHWPASDPIVKKYPALFTEDPTPGLRVSAPLDDGVEQATAAPGEKRVLSSAPTKR